jgi:hypothetical protein
VYFLPHYNLPIFFSLSACYVSLSGRNLCSEFVLQLPQSTFVTLCGIPSFKLIRIGQNVTERKEDLLLTLYTGRAIAQAVMRRLPTAGALFCAQVRSCGVCGRQSGAGAGILRVLRFPLPILIPPTAPHSSSSLIRGWDIRPDSGQPTKWIQSHPTNYILHKKELEQKLKQICISEIYTLLHMTLKLKFALVCLKTGPRAKKFYIIFKYWYHYTLQILFVTISEILLFNGI